MPADNAPDLISVLLVDDDRNDLDFLLLTYNESKGFSSIDYRISADGAIEHWLSLEKLPDVIVSDLNMPRVTGFEFLKKLKKTPSLSSIPVIILSTSNTNTDVMVAKKLGAIGFITKSTSYDGFIKTWEVIRDMCLGAAAEFHYEM